jgi:hypothetical protein
MLILYFYSISDYFCCLLPSLLLRILPGMLILGYYYLYKRSCFALILATTLLNGRISGTGLN